MFDLLDFVFKVWFFLWDLNTRRHWAKAIHRQKSGKFHRKQWKLVKQPEGVRSKKPISCPVCHSSMLLRKSKLGRSRDLGYRNAVFDLLYKCKECALCLSFGVAVPNRHFEYIRALRRKLGIGRVYTPQKDWEQHRRIKERLKELGYW